MNSADSDDIMAELEELGERLRTVAPSQDSRAVQTVNQQGLSGLMGIILGFSVATCIATWVALILFYDDIRDLKAWMQVNTNAITRLESKQ